MQPSFIQVCCQFIYVDWETVLSDEDWDGVVCAYERIRVRWMKVGDKLDEGWDAPHPATQWVHVIGKRIDGRLDGIKLFIKPRSRGSFFILSVLVGVLIVVCSHFHCKF